MSTECDSSIINLNGFNQRNANSMHGYTYTVIQIHILYNYISHNK